MQLHGFPEKRLKTINCITSLMCSQPDGCHIQRGPKQNRTAQDQYDELESGLFNGLQVDTLQHKTVFKEHCTVSSALYVTRDTAHGETDMRVAVSQILPLLIEDLVIAPQLW